MLSIVSRQRKLNFAPGSHFLYSNSNYNLLVIIVERVTGQSLDEVSRAEIFRKMIRGLIAAHEAPGFTMFADDLDLAELARASHGMTGADIKEVLRRVQLAKAMQDARGGGDVAPIGQADLKASITELAGH